MRPRSFSLTSLSQKALRLLPWLAIAGLILYQLAFLIYSPSLLNSVNLGDFGSFIASGMAAQAGNNPYGVYPLTSKAERQGMTVYFPNMNPPVSLLVFEFLTLFDPFYLIRFWSALSILLYLIGLILLYRQYHFPPVWFGWALALAGFWDTLALGQIYTLLFAILVLAWLCLIARREVAAGILIGILVAAKPNLMVWPTLLLLAGYRRPSIWAFAVGSGLSVLPIFRYGVQVYQQWFEAVSQASWTGMPHYLSLFGVSTRFGVPWLGLPLALLLLVIVAGWAWKYHPEILRTSAVALVASILASPLATPRFTMFLVPFIYSRFKETIILLPATLLLVPTSLMIFLGFQSQAIGLFSGLIFPVALFTSIIAIWRYQQHT